MLGRLLCLFFWITFCSSGFLHSDKVVCFGGQGLELIGTSYNSLNVLHGRLSVLDLLHLLLVENFTETVNDLQTLFFVMGLVEKRWVGSFDEHFK